jgi:hypothetical protein
MAWLSASWRRVRTVGLGLSVAFVAQLAFASHAFAAGKVAALVPQVRPNATPELQNRFHESISRGLAGPDAEVIPPSEVRLRIGVSDELLNCGGPGICAARAATALHADKVVAAEITQTGKDYTIHLVMLDAAGREVARAEEPCDICTVKEADDAVQRASARLMLTARTAPAVAPAQPPPQPRPPETPPSTPPPENPPPAATPPTEPTPPGVTPQPATVEKKGFPWKAVAATSLVVGVVGIAIGAPLLAIDGQPTCDKPDPKHSCPEVYDTAGGGAALVTVGVLGVAAGVSLFVVDALVRKRNAPRVSVAPLRGGAMLSSDWRF